MSAADAGRDQACGEPPQTAGTGPSNSAAQPTQESLEDLLRCLNQQIKGSDWLQHNTADKWMQDNPEAAQELQHIITEKQAASTPTSSQQAASAPTSSQQAASAPTISPPRPTPTPSTQ